MDIGGEEIAIAVVAIIIIVVISALAVQSSGGFGSLSDWFSGFGKSKGERICDGLEGEWCKVLYTCQPGYEMQKPGDFIGEWGCCKEGYCIFKSYVDWITNKNQDMESELDIVEFSVINDGKITNLLDLLAENKNLKISYGIGNEYDAVFTIMYSGKDFAYELSTKENNGVIASGRATGSISKRVNLFIGKDDQALQLSAWDPGKPEEKNVRKVVIVGETPYKDGVVVSDAEFRKVVTASDKNIFYVFGSGPAIKKDILLETQDTEKKQHVSVGVADLESVCKEDCETHENCGGYELERGIESDFYCHLCLGNPASELQEKCGIVCGKLGKCISSNAIMNFKFSVEGEKCEIKCQSEFIQVNDFKVEKDGGEYTIFARKGSSWEKIDCRGGIWGAGKCSIKESSLDETFAETLVKNCLDVDKLEAC